MIYINGHHIRLDEHEGLLPWKDYDHVVWLAMDFIRHCPVEPRSGLPWYLVYSCFWTDPLRPTLWPDNPAGKFAMAVDTLVRYYAYSGEKWFIEVVRTMLNRLIAYNTPAGFAWPEVPYASAEPIFGVYFGARADGHYVTEPDKVAQAALGYVYFYKLTGESFFLDEACKCANILAAKASFPDEDHSPWPFRVDVRDGTIIEAYSSHVIPAIKLFDGLIALGAGSGEAYQEGRETAWNWLCQYPLQNNRWKGYFEDIRLDPLNENRDQYSSLETARYLILHSQETEDGLSRARGIIEWVRDELGAAPFYKALPIHEQKFCYHVMGSHTARFAAVCALYARAAGESEYAQLAFRTFNWATYMADENGWVRVGVDEPDYHNQCWFTDGYFDFIPHFLDGMAYLPETAPFSSDHILESTSVIQSVDYRPLQINYRTFDSRAEETLRLTFYPQLVKCGGKLLEQAPDLERNEGWYFDLERKLIQIRHTDCEVEVHGR